MSLWVLSPSGALVPHLWLSHDSGSSLVATSSTHSLYWSGPGAVLWFYWQLTQASKSQICVSERSSLQRGAGRRQFSVGKWGQVYGKGQWREEGAATRGHHGRRRRPQNTKKKRLKGGKVGDIGQLVAGSQGWLPRLSMNNQMSCRVSWVRLRLRPGAQDPSTTMRELTPQGKNCWYPHSMVSFQERFTYDVTDLICIHWEQRVPLTHWQGSQQQTWR